MTTSSPTILIIIVTWNKKNYILELLNSLSDLDYPASNLDILVVDNASQDDTVETIKTHYPQVKLICNQENLGGTGGFNSGLQWAFEQPCGHYQYLWLLDNDVLVHRRALVELVTLLETKPDVAVAGSTMMQLDFPYRINEMGAFINRATGHLVLNRHLETIPLWQGTAIQTLLTIEDVDLSQQLTHCQRFMDVDYVAAASLLIRAEVAKKAGLWRDYFIHFDDVEWCLRIREMGYRVIVSAQSLIWHLSAVAKVPTWVLYYDNRNVLDLLQAHGVDDYSLKRLIRYILKKAVYYQLIGKSDLAQLHHMAVADFKAGHYGKREISLDFHYLPNKTVTTILMNPTIKKILVAWTVNLQATQLQEALVQTLLKRPELKVEFLTLPGGMPLFQMPKSHFIFMPKNIMRWKTYWQLRGHYDLVIQSDYEPSVGLSWLKADLLFVNDEGFCWRSQPKLNQVIKALWLFFKSFWSIEIKPRSN